MKRFVSGFLAVILVVCLSACTVKQSASSGADTAAPIKESVTIVDSSGTELEVSKNCRRIVCVWPSGTQLLVTLGMGDLLVGVSDDSKEQSWAVEMYPRLQEIPSCSNEEAAESILNLDADVVLTTEADVAADWRSKGIPAVTFSYYSVDEMKQTISTLAEIVPDEYAQKCQKYLDYLENNIESVKAALQEKVQEKETLYYIHGNNNKGLYKTAGGETMNEAWAEAANVNFATSDLLTSSETVVDAEAILAKDPSIIVIGGRYQHRLAEELRNTEEWKNIRAVKESRIYTVPYGISPFDRFGAEFALMIPWTASVAYPEYYSFDINKAVKDFYQEFTDYILTDEQVSYIVNGLAPNGKEDIPDA